MKILGFGRVAPAWSWGYVCHSAEGLTAFSENGTVFPLECGGSTPLSYRAPATFASMPDRSCRSNERSPWKLDVKVAARRRFPVEFPQHLLQCRIVPAEAMNEARGNSM